MPAVFIRAPRIRRVAAVRRGPGTHAGEPVLVRQGTWSCGDVPSGADGGPPPASVRVRARRTAARSASAMSLVVASRRRDERRDPDARPPARPTPSARARRGSRAALAASAKARGVVLASASPGIFSAGWDLPYLVGRNRAEMDAFVASYCDLVRQLFVFGPPVVAALSGPRHRRRPHLRDGGRRADRRAGEGRVRPLGGHPRRARCRRA